MNGPQDWLMELAERIRREFGAQLPAAPVRESHADRDRRQEQTKFELETKVLPIVNEQRVASREPALSEAEEDIVVELIGGTGIARTLVIEAIAQGKHVVTANKALLAVHGNQIFAAARERARRRRPGASPGSPASRANSVALPVRRGATWRVRPPGRCW